MADQINVDPERMLAAARGIQTFKEMFVTNLSKNQELAAGYLDAFGGDDFGQNLYQEYQKMASPLWENSGQLTDAVGRVGTNADHSANAWHETNNLAGAPLDAPKAPQGGRDTPVPGPHPAPEA